MKPVIETNQSLKTNHNDDCLKNNLYKNIIEHSLNGVGIEKNGIIIFVNNAFLKILGYGSETEILGKSPLEFVYKDNIQQINDAFEMVRAGKRYNGKLQAQKKDGNVIYLQIIMQPLSDSNEKDQISFITFIDNTQILDIHEQLHSSEKKYETLLNTISEGLLQANSEGKIVFANRAAAKISEYDSPQELLGLPMTDLYVNPDDRNKFLSIIKNEGIVYNYEFLLKTKNLNEKWILSTIKILKDEKGNITGTEGIFRDINDRKIAQDQLRERIKELELLHQISEIAEDSFRPLDIIVRDIVNLIPNSMQYSKFCSVRIEFNQNTYESVDFRETINHIQTNIKSRNKVIGLISVGYRKGTTSDSNLYFSSQEQRLVQSLTERLGKIIERKETEEKVNQLNQEITLTQQNGHIGHWEFFENQFYCSDEVFRILEIKSDTHIIDKNTFSHFVDKNGYNNIKTQIIDLFASHKSFEIEFNIHTKKGNQKHIKMKGFCFENEGQTIFKGTFADISELSDTITKLKDIEIINQNIMDSSYDCIKVLDLEGHLLYMSKGGQKLLEVEDVNDFLNHSWIDLWQSKDQAKVRQAVAAAQNGQTGMFQAFCPTVNHKPKWWDVIITPLYDSKQKVIKLLAISRDITEQKKHEQDLETYKMIAENIQDPMSYLNANFEYQTVNDVYLNYYNLNREDIIGKTPGELIGADIFLNIIKPHMEEVLKGHRVYYEEWVAFPALGRRYMEMNYFPKYSESGDVIGIISQGHDKTSEKKLKDLLKSESKTWRDSINAIDDILIIINKDYSIEKINQKGLELLGLSSSEVVGKKCYEVIHKEKEIKKYCPLQRTLESGKSELTERYEKLFNKYFSIKCSPVFDTKGDIVKFVDLMRDITPSKRLERSLEASNNKLVLAMKIAELGIWHWNTSVNNLLFDENLLNMLGYDGTMPSENPDFWLKEIHEADRKRVVEEYEKFLNKQIPEFTGEFRMRRADYKYLWLSCKAQFAGTYKDTLRVIGIVQNISTQKSLTADLELNKNIINQSPVVVFLWDNQEGWPIDYISDNVYNLVEYSKEDFLTQKVEYAKIIHPDDLNRVMSEVREHSGLKVDSFIHKPYRLITKSGKTKWIEDRTTIIYDENKNITHYQGIVLDITEQVKKQQEFKFQSMLLDQIKDFITATDDQGKITYVNNIVCQLFAKTKDELIGKSVEIFGDNPKKGKTQLEIVKNTMKLGKWRGEVVNYDKEGREIILDFRTQLVFNEYDRSIGMVGISTDITHRKQMEEQIKASEKKYKLIANNSSDLIVVIENFKLNYVSPSVEKILGYTVEEAMTLDYLQLFHPEEKNYLQETIDERLMKNTTKPLLIQFRLKNKNEQYIWIEAAINTKIEKNNKRIAIINVRDITLRKKTEEVLQKSESLLHEAQHIGKIGSYETPFRERALGGLKGVLSDIWF
ncbi:MAG: PAS domain S-box protein [Candidatus Marinimicrobia bacterium]|nr:PAS domain S-box protein [Candidatus Neomarinimicrobiota bacterium]